MESIPDAMGLAEMIAETIVKYSFKWDLADRCGVKDIMLYGSTITKRRFNPAEDKDPDIDFLLIHHNQRLLEYGIMTRYDEVTHSNEYDPDTDLIGRPYSAVKILESLGTPKTPDYWDAREEIVEEMKELTSCLRNPDNTYSGTVQSKYLGYVTIPRSSLKGMIHYISEIIDGYVMTDSVSSQVEAIMESRKLPIVPTLNILVMHDSVLNPTNEWAAEQREKVLQQSKNHPGFWYTIFDEGMLYNFDECKFSIPAKEKYPQALALFKEHPTN
jgi:hypothetical protein